MDDAEFNLLWTDLSRILVALGDDENELDKLKTDRFSESSSQPINEENVRQTMHFNSLGTQAHKDGRYSEAITLFTKAVVLPGVKDQDRAVVYSNMSSSRLALYESKSKASNRLDIDSYEDERYRALQDAKQARILWSTWWKAHFRVGKIYVAMNENEKAIRSFERALALAPSNNEVQDALSSARQVHGQQTRKEHLDPRLQPRTMDEGLKELQEKLGLDPQKVRMTHRSLEKSYPAGADVVKGHKYEHGDVDTKQDYEQAARYFAKAARQGNAEGIYNLARLTDHGLGVEKDHQVALKLFQQAAAQPSEHPLIPGMPNLGVAESEHALGLRYAEGVGVHKCLPTAAYWYQRGTDHGCAESANNLGLMYKDGVGVERDLKKAQQLLELSAKGGDPNAMLTLAGLLLDNNDLQMAKIWYDRACESGSAVAQSHRSNFEKAFNRKNDLLKSFTEGDLQKFDAVKNFFQSFTPPSTIHKQQDHSHIFNYEILNDYANRGSVTARRLCDAFGHFCQALFILLERDTPTEEEENFFIVKLAECYRIEHIVAQFPGVEIRQKGEKIIDRVLKRASVDEEARICFAVSHMDSHEMVARFLEQCKQKYPKSIYFYELSSAIQGWLKNYEACLYEANAGLQIDPNYCELLYNRAVALRLIGTDNNETIVAYQQFISKAPNDHRKIPESYYAMGTCYSAIGLRDRNVEKVKEIFKEGEEAEERQLPCFLPYQSNTKLFLSPLCDPRTQSVLKNPSTATIPDRKSDLSNPRRIEIIKRHRQWEAQFLQIANSTNLHFLSQTRKPRLQQTMPKSLVGLKPISLREMDPNKDHVYHGYVLSITIVEEAYHWTPSIHLVVEDEHLDCENMAIYGFPENQGKHLINDVFTIGSKMDVINPYLRLGANDMKPMIRVDDFSSIIIRNESERVHHMCRCCGQANASHVCSKCKRARYCSKECQTMDWKVFQHKLICRES